MNLIIDVDGVICQYDFPTIIKKHFGVDIPKGAIYTYSIEDALGVSSVDVGKMFQVETHAEPKLMPGAIKSLWQFLDSGFEVCLFTNRLNFMTVEELEDWLGKWEIPYSSILTPQTLPNYTHACIDDSPQKLMLVDSTINVKHPILFTGILNKRCLNITGRMIRAKNWKEVRKIINGY